MGIRSHIARFGWTAVIAAAACAAPAQAQLGSAEGRAFVLQPLSLINAEALSFGDVVVGAAAGTVIVDPDTNTRAVAGGVTAAGGTVSAARFLGTGTPNSNVAIIREPRGQIIVTNTSGPETMIVDNFTVEGGNGARQIREDRVLDFRIGGTLHVGANQAEGSYVGTFEVIVDYR